MREKYKLVIKDADSDLYTNEEKFYKYFNDKAKEYQEKLEKCNSKSELRQSVKEYKKFFDEEEKKVWNIKKLPGGFTKFKHLDNLSTVMYYLLSSLTDLLKEEGVENTKLILTGKHPNYSEPNIFNIYEA